MRAASRRWCAYAVALALCLAVMPPGSPALADHGERTLDLEREKTNNPIDVEQRVRAVLSSPPDPGTQIEIDFEIVGPGDPDDGNTPESPDLSCTVTGVDDPGTGWNEAIECRVFYSGAAGAFPNDYDEIRGWIDHDFDNSTVEADMGEGPDERVEPGDSAEPDSTDVVLRKAFEGLHEGSSLACSPERATIPVSGPGSVHMLECELRVSDGERLAGWLIDGENLNGANDPDDDDGFGTSIDYDDACTTDAHGRCDISIAPVDDEVGTAEICFWVDEDDDSSFHQNPPRDGAECVEGVDAPENDNQTDVIEVTWEEPPPPPPPPPPTPRTVTLGSSKEAVTFGRVFALTGQVDATDPACRQGVPVTLQREAPEGEWVTISTVETSPEGSYDSSIEGDRSATYRALLDSASDCEASTSEPTQVGVRTKVNLKPSKNRVHKGRQVRLRVKVLPCSGHEGDKVKLLKRVDGKFRQKAVKRTSANCKVVFKRRIFKKNAFKVVSPKQSQDFLQGVSPLRRIRVK